MDSQDNRFLRTTPTGLTIHRAAYRTPIKTTPPSRYRTPVMAQNLRNPIVQHPQNSRPQAYVHPLSLIPDSTCKNTRQLLVLNEDGTGECFDNKAELLAKCEMERCHNETSVLIKNFNFSVFQRYTINGVVHYNPIFGTLDNYLSGNLTSLALKSDIRLNKLGEGSFGKIISYGDSSIAIKFSNRALQESIDFIKEYAIMKYLSNIKGVSSSYDLRTEQDGIQVYMKKMTGDMESFVNDPNFYSQRKRIFFEICTSMYHAHSKGIVHLDLKWENILIHKNQGRYIPYIADWGLAKFLPYTEWFSTSSGIGTWGYRPPENFMKGKRDLLLFDVYSLGIIGLELDVKTPHIALTPNNPVQYQTTYVFPEDDHEEIMDCMHNIYHDITSPYNFLSKKLNMVKPDTMSDLLYDLLNDMVCNLPNTRLKIHEVMNHPYFDEFRNGEMYPEIDRERILINSKWLNYENVTIEKNYGKNPLDKCLAVSLNSEYGEVLSNILRGLHVGNVDVQIFDYLKRIDYNIIGTCPRLFLKDVNETACKMLAAYDRNVNRIHPCTAAMYIAQVANVECWRDGRSIPDNISGYFEGYQSINISNSEIQDAKWIKTIRTLTEKYIGTVDSNGVYQGFGTLSHNRALYSGVFESGRKYGMGTETYNGVVYTGRYDDVMIAGTIKHPGGRVEIVEY